MKEIVLNPAPFPKDQLMKVLETHDIHINRYAESFFAHPAFSTENAGKRTLVVATLREMGLEDGATLHELCQHLEKTCFEACPLNTGLFLRLQWKDQPQSQNTILSGTHQAPDQSVTVFSEIIEEDDAFPKGLYLRNVDGELWLRGYVCDSSYRFSQEDRFAFARRDR